MMRRGDCVTRTESQGLRKKKHSTVSAALTTVPGEVQLPLSRRSIEVNFTVYTVQRARAAR